jgi:hypothetical protein
MSGDPFPNNFPAGRLRQVAEECGATVYAEQPARISRTTVYADLVIEKEGRRIVGKVEPSCRRVRQDVGTAVALGAQLLLIVTPDALTAQACRRRLRRLRPVGARLNVMACPLGAALEILRQALTAQCGPAAPVASNPRKES